MRVGSRKTPRRTSSSGTPRVHTPSAHLIIEATSHRLDYGGGKDLSLPECPREQLEEDERGKEVERVEELVGVLEDGVDVRFSPGGVDHEEACVAEGVGVVVHEYAVISGMGMCVRSGMSQNAAQVARTVVLLC